ncbi:MAG: c-type cytochrome [Thermoanaerobaculia bacterium]
MRMPSAALRAIAVSSFAILVISAAPSLAQERWSWPEHPKNLQILKGMSGEQLRPVMVGFTRALGVRCNYCHVGEEGKPFTEWDFPSDAKPAKKTARQMLVMLRMINDQLKEVQPSGDQRVNMWCGTCHHGKPRPMTLEESLDEAYRQGGVKAAVDRYHELRDRYYGRGAYDFGERSLNQFGYELLGKSDLDGGITILRLNAEMFPQSGNVWDSLAEAYAKEGKPELAEIYYRKSLELDPENRHALEELQKIRSANRQAP